ncbi:hypothetical protein HK097_005086 [Rhizophlyctis rosea]|uniref:Ubiquinol-cytochrome C reductase hinge domain-containing protein n=1 Tax=Rhizophlyctis rosea TaxID=64517 RepID=A0AAD5SJ95_9FUNG|nr:hypothetical protein HK097_005086 [Rhizophlyctis rosea]
MSEIEAAEIVDPKPAIEEGNHHCHSFKEKFDKCQARVEGGDAGEETCVEEFFDLMECVGHCSAPKLWAKLK